MSYGKVFLVYSSKNPIQSSLEIRNGYGAIIVFDYREFGEKNARIF